MCNSKFFFRSPSFDTANWVSRELGESELEEVKEGISYSESAMRSGISISKHQRRLQIVSPSDIMRLPDLHAYVRLVGGYPITQVNLPFQKRKECAEHFIAREMGTLNELDQLIKNAEKEKVSISDLNQKEIKNQEVSIEW